MRCSVCPGCIGSTFWVRFSAWIWDFSSTHSTTAFPGGRRYSPITSATLASSSGSVENLNVSALHGLTPNRFQALVMPKYRYCGTPNLANILHDKE